jgi:hypothetical protein
MALSAAGVGAVIPGFIEVKLKAFLQAGGAIAVFVVVYFFSPARLVTESDSSNNPKPEKDSQYPLKKRALIHI